MSILQLVAAGNIPHSTRGLVRTYSNTSLHEYCVFRFFFQHYSCSIFIGLHVVSIFVGKVRTVENNSQNLCLLHSQEEWQAISKGFAWIQTFHLGDSPWLKICSAKRNSSLLRSSQRDTSSSTFANSTFIAFLWFVCKPTGTGLGWVYSSAMFSNTSAMLQSEEAPGDFLSWLWSPGRWSEGPSLQADPSLENIPPLLLENRSPTLPADH